MIGEVSTRVLSALAINQVAPISIEGPKATMKGTQIKMGSLLIP